MVYIHLQNVCMTIYKKFRILVQDGGVEGHVLISSCESTKITTSRLTTINRMTVEPSRKIPHIQRQRRSCSEKVERAQSRQNQIPYPLSGWPTNWRTVIPKEFSHYFEDLEPHIRLPSLGTLQSDWESPGNLTLKARKFDYKTSTALGETETPVLEGTNKTLIPPKLRGEEQWLHRKLNQNYLSSVEGWCSPVEA